jgi:hypothetical protein
MRTLAEARNIVDEQLAARVGNGRCGNLRSVDFILCEDGSTVMIYIDTDDENDAVAVWFDLPDGLPFDPEEFRVEFLSQSQTVH